MGKCVSFYLLAYLLNIDIDIDIAIFHEYRIEIESDIETSLVQVISK